jgi:hypothetical protein
MYHGRTLGARLLRELFIVVCDICPPVRHNVLQRNSRELRIIPKPVQGTSAAKCLLLASSARRLRTFPEDAVRHEMLVVRWW